MNNPDLSTSFADGKIKLSTCIYNASGPRSGTAAALTKIAASRAGAVLTKSATVEAQSGNPQPRTWHQAAGMASLNSEGLPNQGIDYYIAESTISEVMNASSSSKPYIVSLSGKTLADNLEMIRRIAASPTLTQIASVELNLACPNVLGKPIIAYDMEQLASILAQVEEQITTLNNEATTGVQFPPLGVKLPPYLDRVQLSAVARLLQQHSTIVSYVVCINTLGHALAVDGAVSEAPYIASNQGFAGLSGPAIKYTALANVRLMYTLLQEEASKSSTNTTIDVIGVGGVQSGQDAFDLILAGAAAVQVATCHWQEGPTCFDRICQELEDIMRRKNYKSIGDFQGKLKEWSKEGAALVRQQKQREDDVKAREKQPGSSGSPTASGKASELKVYKTLCGLLVLVVAVLLANLRSSTSLLPSEE